MSDSYEIFPKIVTPSYGSMFQNKVSLDCTLCSEVNFDEELHKEKDLVIPPESILFYVEDAQFYAASKIYRQPMSAWIRLHFITNDRRSLWYTLLCSPQRVWDFETIRRRRKMVEVAMEEHFRLLISGEDDIEQLKVNQLVEKNRNE